MLRKWIIPKYQSPFSALPSSSSIALNMGLSAGNLLDPYLKGTNPSINIDGLRNQYSVNPSSASGLKNTFGKIGGWMGNTTGRQLATKGLDVLTGMVNADEDSSYNTEQQLGSALMSSGNPYAMAAGAIVKANSALNQAFNSNTNTLNKKQAISSDISGAARTANNVAGFINNITPPGLNPGTYIRKTHDAYMSQETENLRSAYTDSVDDINTAQTMGGRRYLFGRRKANRFIDEANRKNEILTALGLDTKERFSAVPDNSRLVQKQNYNKYNGGLQNVVVGKEGLQLPDREWLNSVYTHKDTAIKKFEEGGVIGVEQNIIPEGALHAHKNNLEEINPNLDAVTEKGIPVITTDSKGEYTQVAEIERDELVLTKELTTKLEALWKDGSEAAMLEAGKLLASELMENTINNGNKGD